MRTCTLARSLLARPYLHWRGGLAHLSHGLVLYFSRWYITSMRECASRHSSPRSHMAGLPLQKGESDFAEGECADRSCACLCSLPVPTKNTAPGCIVMT